MKSVAFGIAECPQNAPCRDERRYAQMWGAGAKCDFACASDDSFWKLKFVAKGVTALCLLAINYRYKQGCPAQYASICRSRGLRGKVR